MRLQNYDRNDLVEHYEELRRESLEAATFGRRGAGLWVFVTRGMLGWLAVLTALPPLPTRRAEPRLEGGPQLLGPTRSELTTVISSMVLACTEPRRPYDAQHQ